MNDRLPKVRLNRLGGGSFLRLRGAHYSLLALGAALVFACGERPRIRTSVDYQGDPLVNKVVLLVPLAVSSELGDERTGIVLSDQARFGASAVFCSRAIKKFPNLRIVCGNVEHSKNQRAFADLEREFALDKPIAPATLQSAQSLFRADFALLFRPESASSLQQIVHNSIVGGVLGTDSSHNNPRHCVTSNTCFTIRNETDTTYVISSVLIDLRTGRALKSGTLSDHASRTVARDLGYAESAPMEPLLESILIRLGTRMLER